MNDEAPPQPKKLSDFKPLKRLVLPDLGELDCSGLTIIVGPNSGGKTQLLRDIRGRTTGEIRELVVATDLETETPELEPLIECLKREGQIETEVDESGREKYKPRTVFAGTGQPAQNIMSADASKWHTRSKTQDNGRQQNKFFNWAATYLVTALFLENRLLALNSPGLIDFLEDPPQHDLHALHLNDEAQEALIIESKHAFSKAIWPDISRGNQLSLRISQERKYFKGKNIFLHFV